MSRMDDLVQWLRTQLDEDEKIATAPTRVTWASAEWEFTALDGVPSVDLGTVHLDAVSSLNELEMCHIARHDPARVLREIDAKRQVVRALESAEVSLRNTAPGTELHTLMTGAVNSWRAAVRMLAAVYADRPGYREEWRP